MIKWTSKLPDQLNLNQDTARGLYQKRVFCLIGISFLGLFVVFLLPSNSFPAIATIFITVILFLICYIRWRSFFLSYWYICRSNSLYYEDYTWRDSLIIALILILGIGLSGLILFYIASKVDFARVQPI